jgi:3-oxoacyl-[acyl-carrier protein] reductase
VRPEPMSFAEGRKVAIVVGADGPIGSAVASQLPEYNLVISGSPEACLTLKRRLETRGRGILSSGHDFCDTEPTQVVSVARECFGAVHVFADCSYDVGDSGRPFQDRSIEECLQRVTALVPAMTESGGGQIIITISSAGRYRTAYFAPKDTPEQTRTAMHEGAKFALTRQLAFELASNRIRVNAVCLGWILTPSSQRAWNKLDDRERRFILEEIPLRRLGTADEAAAAIVFLAEDSSSYLTGTVIDVNGGWWMS